MQIYRSNQILVIFAITLLMVGRSVKINAADGEKPDQSKFVITVERISTKDNLITGKLYVNGKEIGTCYENEEHKIPLGTFKAHNRLKSGKNHVQSPGGVLSKEGDFLIELDDFKVGDRTRSVIQFHAGNKPSHSLGCILCGPATTKDGKIMADEPLKKLRLLYFDGEDKPKSDPKKKITVEVKEAKRAG